MANMKQNVTCSRSKPPPARSSSYGLGRTRTQMNVELPSSAVLHTMQTQESHKVASDKTGSGSSGFSDKTSAPASIIASPKEVSDCLSGWVTYLQMLTGLCGAGSRLSHCLGTLVQDTSSPCHAVATQCQATWDELVKATTSASAVVKAQVIPTLQDVSDADSDSQKAHEHNQQVVCGSLMTFINLQYQFCVACCDFLGAMANSNCCQMNEATSTRHNAECIVGIVQQCFSQLYTPIPPPPPPGSHRLVRSPLHFPLCSLQGPQRRWSEAAAGEVQGETNDGTMRRWSMPWESSRLAEHHNAWHGRLNPPSKLAVPSLISQQDRSRSTTPDSVWHSSLASQEELQGVIQLLSCRPGVTHSTQLYHPSQHLPGVTLTSCPYDGPSPDCSGWSESVQSDERGGSCGPSRRGSSSPQPLAPQQHVHRASWHASDTHTHMWGEHEGQVAGERFDLYPPTPDASMLASRKSSSSTDSSSSHSLHSRSTTGSEGGAEVRAHLYSMWSGSDLAFMKLPESSEPADMNVTATTTTTTSTTSSSTSSGDGAPRFPQLDAAHTYYSSSK